jgi:hypothetical protein
MWFCENIAQLRLIGVHAKDAFQKVPRRFTQPAEVSTQGCLGCHDFQDHQAVRLMSNLYLGCV